MTSGLPSTKRRMFSLMVPTMRSRSLSERPAMCGVMPLVERGAVERAVFNRSRHRLALLERGGERFLTQHWDARRRASADGSEMRNMADAVKWQSSYAV